MAKYEAQIQGDFDDILMTLNHEILESGLSMDLIDQSDFRYGDTKIGVRVYDKYFMRTANRASLSLTIVGENDHIMISAIGAGGGSGAIFNFSLGAESDMVAVVEDCIERMITK